MILLHDEEIIKIIYEWSFSKEVLETLNEESENAGILILMELYKGSTYKIRKNVFNILCRL
jgi:hypothetical protein